VDVVIVIGGFNSSNTGHLCEIASQHAKAYHIDDASCILSADQIRHKPVGAQQPMITQGWLPQGRITVAVTAGASTPNRVVGDAIERILRARGHALKSLGFTP